MIRKMKLEWVTEDIEGGRHMDGLLISANLADIFDEPPEVKISRGRGATSGDCNLFLSTPPLGENVILPNKVPAVKLVGNYKRGTHRRVYQYIGPESGLDFRFGLTVHEAHGTWSSEPHDFEIEALKSLKPLRFWERFAYITDPPHGWGIQTRQGFLDDCYISDIQLIRDRDILSIPLGTHPVTAGPGVRLAYFWVYQADDISAAEKF